jgi:hypothetical protein
MKKCSIQFCKEKHVIFKKKLMLANLNLWKKSLLRTRNPQKFLEKSKNLELNPRKFWSLDPGMKNCSKKIHLEGDADFF